MQVYKINGLLVEITTDVSLDFTSQRLLFKFELNQSDPKLPISLKRINKLLVFFL